MENNEEKIGENTSSGAEKVKTVERKKNATAKEKREEENKNAERRKATAKERAAKKDGKKLSKAELKDRKRERKMQLKARAMEKKAERKEMQAKRAAERAKRRDLLKNETAVQRLERKQKEKEQRLLARAKAHERKHELALQKREAALAKKQARLEERKHKREQKTRRREHAPGFGGWLAAVIALGTASLAMATVITAGAVNMVRMNGDMLTGYMAPVYELDGAADNMHAALSKLRVASSSSDQAELLTDLLANGEVAACDLERIPVDSLTASSLTGFVGKTVDFARETLRKLASGEDLDEDDYATIAYLYETNTKIRTELDRLCTSMCDKDMMALLKGKTDGMLGKTFSSVSEGTLAVPESITKGPFAEKLYKVNAKALESYEEISSAEGESLVKKYLEGYSVTDVECTGEATVKGFTCFNYTARDDRGRDFFVQLSEKGGKLVLFDSFEECPAHNYDLDKCVEIASEFLKDCGFEGMTPVFSFETGTTADINFCYEQDGVICYADMVKVKVCETRGVVTGAEAFPYWLNHTTRDIPTATLTQADAEAKMDKVDVETTRLCLTPVFGKETLCYEITGNYMGETYYIYLDTNSGKEVKVYTLVNSDAGKVIA